MMHDEARCRCRGAEVQRFRCGAEVQRCRFADSQRCKVQVQQVQVQIADDAEVQMMQRCTGAEVLSRRCCC
jgi:hypothetical protein